VTPRSASGGHGRQQTGPRDGVRDDRGAGTVLVLAVAVCAVVLAAAVGALGAAVTARHRAAAVADLAALAAASAVPPDCSRAAILASRSGAAITGCQVLGDGSVVVEVRTSLPVAFDRWAPGAHPVARARAGRVEARVPPDPERSRPWGSFGDPPRSGAGAPPRGGALPVRSVASGVAHAPKVPKLPTSARSVTA